MRPTGAAEKNRRIMAGFDRPDNRDGLLVLVETAYRQISCRGNGHSADGLHGFADEFRPTVVVAISGATAYRAQDGGLEWQERATLSLGITM